MAAETEGFCHASETQSPGGDVYKRQAIARAMESGEYPPYKASGTSCCTSSMLRNRPKMGLAEQSSRAARLRAVRDVYKRQLQLRTENVVIQADEADFFKQLVQQAVDVYKRQGRACL